jgi:hypothetical protein
MAHFKEVLESNTIEGKMENHPILLLNEGEGVVQEITEHEIKPGPDLEMQEASEILANIGGQQIEVEETIVEAPTSPSIALYYIDV